MGTDVYYLKQITTPSGYEILVNNEYIKVIVNKKWDSETDKYIVEVNTEIINSDDYEADEPEIEVSSSKTGIIHRIIEYTNVTWTVNKVGIQNSKNEGTIYSAYINAAGLLGRGKTSVLIENCENSGTVKAGFGNVGGLLGEITKVNELSFIEIYDSNNKGNIEGIKSSNNQSVAGIVAFSEPDTILNNCINEGIISSNNYYTAGLIGTIRGDIEAYNCNNAGEIILKGGSYNSSCAGGIIGQAYSENSANKGLENRTRKIIIDNCHNTANIESFAHTGGIIAKGFGKTIDISNCSSTGNINIISYGDLGGIIGYVCSTKIEVSDCNVSNGNMTVNVPSSSGSTGGIIGCVQKDYNGDGIIVERIKISNCNVNNADINAKKDVGGMIGGTYFNDKVAVEIINCTVEDTNILNDCRGYGTNCSAGGIISHAFDGLSVNISDCKLNNVKVIYGLDDENYGGSDVNVGGVIAVIQNVNDFSVENCNLNHMILRNYTRADRVCTTTGGIVGASNYGNVYNLKNCEVDDLDLYTVLGNAGGICAGGTNVAKEMNIEACNVKNSNIINDSTDHTNANTSGIIANGPYDGVLNIKNSNFTNSSLLGKGTNVAGILAWGRSSNGDIIDCDVKDCEITAEKDAREDSTNSATGGIIAYIYNSNISDCDVTNTRIDARGSNIAGIVAVREGNNELMNITNCSVVESNITDENMETGLSNYNLARGGITGTVLRNTTYTNCLVKDTQIKAKAKSIGGVAGDIIGTTYKFENCTVDNVDIYATGVSDFMSSSCSVGGILGDAVTGYRNYEKNIVTGCTVKDLNIESTTDNLGGIVGASMGNMEIDDCIVENVDLTQKNEITSSRGYKKAVGGCIATLSEFESTNNLEITIKNPTITGLNITVRNGVDDTIQAGGILGYALKANVSGATIAGLNIDNNTPNGLASGICAVASGKDGTLNNEIQITDSSLSNSTINGKGHVGGFVGFTTIGEIENSSVDTSDIISEGTDGIVGGFAAVVSNNELETSGVRESKIAITSSSLKTILLKGLNFISEFLGAGNIEISGTKSEGTTLEGMPEESIPEVTPTAEPTTMPETSAVPTVMPTTTVTTGE